MMVLVWIIDLVVSLLRYLASPKAGCCASACWSCSFSVHWWGLPGSSGDSPNYRTTWPDRSPIERIAEYVHPA